MENSNGGLYFGMGLDNEKLRQDAKEAKDELVNIGTTAEQQGERMDQAINSGLDNAKLSQEADKMRAELSNIGSAVTKIGTLLEQNINNINDTGDAARRAGEEAGAAIEDANRKLRENESIMVRMLGGYDNYKGIIDALPAPLRNAVNGINSMTGAAKKFIATPLGAVLAALILAFQAVKTALTSTVDGQLRLAEITGKVSGVLGQLKEVVIKVGEALIKAFDEPGVAVKKLGDALKNNFMNRLKAVGDTGAALGKILKSAFTLNLDGVKEGVKELGESLVQFTTGVDNLGEKVGEWVQNVKSAAEETGAIKRETRELEIAVSEWQVRNQELEQQKAEARGKMYNTSLSTAERKKAKADFEKALNEQITAEADFADKRIALQKRSMALTSNTIEDENVLRDLEAQRAAIETKRVTQMASLERRSGAIANQEIRGAQAGVTAEQKRVQALQELGNMEANLTLSNNERRISLMRDGLNKTLEEIRYEKEQEQQTLKELEDKFRKENEKAGVQTGETGLTTEQTEEIEKARELIDQTYRENTKRALENSLQDYLTYEQTRTRIQEEYARKRDALYKKDADGNVTGELREGVTQANVDNLDNALKDTLGKVDEQFAARSTDYQLWCEQIAAMSLEQLSTALDDAKAALEKAKTEGVSGDELAVAEAKVAKAQEALAKETAKQAAITPGQRSIKEWKDLYEALNQCKQAFDEVGEAVGGLAGDILSTAGAVAADTMSMINGIVQLANWSVTATQRTTEGVSKAMQSVEKASVVLTVISTAFQIAMKIINAIKDSHDDKLEKDIETTQKQVDSLQKSYDRLGKAIDEAYSKDAGNLIEQQNRLIAQQQELIAQQMRDEQAKKDSDQERIDGYMDKIAELNERLEDNKKKAVDAIFGEDLQSAIENFSDAYADAWTQGEKRSMAVKDTVKAMMRQMVTESIKAAVQAGGQMEAIREKLQEFYADGVLTDWEQQYVLNMANEIQKDLDRKFAWADSLMKNDSEEQRAGTTGGGITTASQETVDELNGRATAIQGHTFSIAENTQRLLATTNAILNSVLHIEDHTDGIRADVTDLKTGMKEIRSTVNDISIKGIKLR